MTAWPCAGTSIPVICKVGVSLTMTLPAGAVALAAGESETYDGDTCLFIPSGAAGDRYTVAITRPKLIEDPNDVPDVALRVDPVLTAARLAPGAPVAPATASVRAPGARSGQAAQLGTGLDGTPGAT